MKSSVSYSKKVQRTGVIFLLAVAVLFLSMTFYQKGEAKEKFPEKPVVLVVPFGAGSGTDVFARGIQPFASKHLGVNVIIENIPAGNTVVGYTKVYTAKPDGYTISTINLPSIFVERLMFNPVYDPQKFTPVAAWADMPMVIATNPDTYKDFNQFMEIAHKKKLSMASMGGVGSAAWIAILLIEKEAGIEFNKVPYSGGEAGVQVAGKHLDAVLAGSSAIISLVKSGQLKPIVALYDKRDLLYPDVPTYKELGYKSTMFAMHRGVVGPPNMPEDIVKILETGFLKAAMDPEYLEMANKMNIIVNPISSRDYHKKLNEVYQSIEPFFDLLKQK